MIEELQPYSEYKESGQKWLGRTPKHWNIHLAGQIGRLLKGSGGSKADNVEEGLPCVRYGQLYTTYRGFIHSPKNFIRPSHASRYTAIHYGDVLFAASGEKVDEIGKSAVNLMRTPAVCGGDMIILRPRMDVYPPFLGHALDCYASASQKAAMCRGSTIKHIYPDELRQLRVSLPPPDEQAAIVRFLEHANRKIDGFIRAKRKLIGLLNEQKQAIIHRAVTRGLNPNVPLKPSGIPWLGDIPKHWETVRCGNLLQEVVDVGHPESLLLSIDRFKGIIPQADTGRRTRASKDRSAYKRVRPGQLAYNLMNAFMGALGFSEHDGIVSPAYAVARPLREIETRYYHHLLRTTAYAGEYNRLSYGIMYERNRLYFERFKLVRALVPPLDEQREIADWIAVETRSLNTAIARTEREIALMQEYRTRLTADVVTGKLDVRAAAEKLPDLAGQTHAELDESSENGEVEEVEA